MTMEYELKLLKGIRKMASLNKTQIAEQYQTPIDNAEDYFKTKTMAALDVVIESLQFQMAKDDENRAEEDEHYKGVAEGDIPPRYF